MAKSGKKKPVEESEEILSGSEEALGSEDALASGSDESVFASAKAGRRSDGSGETAGSGDLLSDSQGDTDDAPPPEGTEESAALKAGKSGRTKAAAGKSGARKSASGTQKAVSGKAGKTTGKSKAVSGRRSGAVPAARPRTSGHELVPVICSECHEEFMFDTGVKTDSLTCPVCEHVAGRPDDATLHHVAERRRQEKGAFTLAAVFVGVGLVAFLAWAFLMHDPNNHADSAKFWGPLAVSIMSALALAIFGWKYETNRWETYF